MKYDTKTEEELTCRFKIDMRNLMNFVPSTRKSKKFCFNGFLVTKVQHVWAKKVQTSYLSWHWRVMRNLRKTDLWLKKWHEKLGKFPAELLKLSKLGIWWDSLVQSRKCMTLKFTEGYVSWQWRIMQNLKRDWLVISKLTWVIWRILTQELEYLKNLLFNWLLWPKYIIFELTKEQKSYFWWH